MSHQCPFPVQSSDNRCGYRAGSAPGFTLSLALVAALSGYAGLSEAAPAAQRSECHCRLPFLRCHASAGPKAACWWRRVPACPTRSSTRC